MWNEKHCRPGTEPMMEKEKERGEEIEHHWEGNLNETPMETSTIWQVEIAQIGSAGFGSSWSQQGKGLKVHK